MPRRRPLVPDAITAMEMLDYAADLADNGQWFDAVAVRRLVAEEVAAWPEPDGRCLAGWPDPWP